MVNIIDKSMKGEKSYFWAMREGVAFRYIADVH